MGHAHPSAGENGNPTRMGHLFQQEDPGAGVMRRNGGDPAGKTISHHNHIGFLIPVFNLFHGFSSN
jgi:hypothetical protein